MVGHLESRSKLLYNNVLSDSSRPAGQVSRGIDLQGAPSPGGDALMNLLDWEREHEDRKDVKKELTARLQRVGLAKRAGMTTPAKALDVPRSPTSTPGWRR